MDIMNIENKRVMCSARSITVKDEYGKTAGIVRGLTRLTDASPRQVYDIHEKFNQIRGGDLCKWGNAYIDGSTLYYIDDLYINDLYNDPRMRATYSAERIERFEEWQQRLQNACDVVVIRAYVLK